MKPELTDPIPDRIRDELDRTVGAGRRSRYARVAASALGSIPWVGGVISAGAAIHGEQQQGKINELQAQWLKLHEQRLRELADAIQYIVDRLDTQVAEQIDERINSEEYLALVHQAFRAWDQAETDEKRKLLQDLLANAAASRICTDDVVRLFIDWIARYSELHFKVIRVIYRSPGITRGRMWQDVYGNPVREDSAEADLFKLIIHDLSTGRIARQDRETDGAGNFYRSRERQRRGPFLTSAFEDGKPYVLTELGKQFIHYAMSEVVPRIGSPG